jgi:toxin ParE1/3/4
MAHRFAPQVEAELDDIWWYVASASGDTDIADRLVDSITARFLLLARYPYAGRRRDEDLRPGLRSFPVGSYVIIYKTENEEALILHVLHGRRDIPTLLGP